MASKLSKPLSAGDVVVVDKPLVHIINDQFKDKFCDNCLKRSDQLKRCSKCLQMFYCDRNCQTIDWKYHKNECKLFRHKMSTHPEISSDVRYLLRFWLCIKSDETFTTKKYKLFDGSDISLNDIEVKDIENPNNLLLFELMCNQFSAYGLDFNHKELFHWFKFLGNQTCCRALTSIQFPKGLYKPLEIGSALYIQFARLSHSCVPNCALIPNGLSVSLRAMRSVTVGEGLTIKAMDLSLDKRTRHQLLKELSIDCKCPKCEGNTDSEVDYSLFRRLRDYLNLYFIENDSQVVNKLLEIFPKVMSYCDSVYGKYEPQKSAYLYMYLFVLFNSQCPDTELILRVRSQLFDAISVTHGKDDGLTVVVNKLFANHCCFTTVA